MFKVHNKIEQVQRVPIRPRPRTCTASSASTPPRVMRLLQLGDLDPHVVTTQRPSFTSGFTLGAPHSMSRKCIINVPITVTSCRVFSLPANPLPRHPSLPSPSPNPGNHRSYCCLHRFAFFRMLYSWNLTIIQPFQIGFFSTE